VSRYPFRRSRAGALVLSAFLCVAAGSAAVPRHLPTPRMTRGSIQHVVVIFQENHSFDNVLGFFCVKYGRCDGAETGVLPDGRVIPLAKAPDVVPDVYHGPNAQRNAIDGGKMDGFGTIGGCTEEVHYRCYSQYHPTQIPNMAALATGFAISDRTFENTTSSSWGSHLQLVTGDSDGFTGTSPFRSGYTSYIGPGWGCDSYKDAHWLDPTGQVVDVPTCVPDRNGFGPYRPSPVKWIPTIMDRLGAGGLPWRIYADRPTGPQPLAYMWAICPTFADCLFTGQMDNLVDQEQILTDAAQGTLPSFSILVPNGPAGRTSQHNLTSMVLGDNWIGEVVSAIENGPDWMSTAVFITYDECGCFYDHVPPPRPDFGVRVPMLIVSPWVRAGFTDSNVASFASMLAFTEHAFGLLPLNSEDGSAYDFRDAFHLSQRPLPPVRMVDTPVPAWELRLIDRYARTARQQNDPT
jgi:phospholipase C